MDSVCFTPDEALAPLNEIGSRACMKATGRATLFMNLDERIEKQHSFFSTAYPQARCLVSLLMLNQCLTGLWHVSCNKYSGFIDLEVSAVSQQRLPVSKLADRELTRTQSDLVDLIMSTGQSVAECADQLGRDVANCYRDLRKPHVKKELQARTLEHMGVLAPYAALTQQQLLVSDSDHVRASVAENILDRHLGKPVMRQQIAHQGTIDVKIDLS